MIDVLALFGSPRRGGNTDRLLEAFLDGAEDLKARCSRIVASEETLSACTGCRHCETSGQCIIEDGMQRVYDLLEKADLIVLASPIYFYGLTAQAKALVDRSQALWSRKYKLRIRPSKAKVGFLISAGGSKGKNLFECAERTMRYFCDAVHAEYAGALTFRSLDAPEDIEKHPEYLEEARRTGRKLTTDLASRAYRDKEKST